MLLIDVFKAVRAGKELKNASTWANVSSLSQCIGVILSFSVGAAKWAGLDIPVTDEQLLTVGGSLAAILMTGGAVINLATTKGAGL